MAESAPRRDPVLEVPSAATGENVLVDVGAEEEPAAPISGPIPAKQFVGRSPGQLAWLRLKRDKTATTSGFVVLFFIVVAIAAPLIELIYGYGPTQFTSKLLDTTSLPLGYLGGVTFSTDNPSNHIHILGVVPQTGQDLFILLVYGARTSLGIAFSAAIVSVMLGILFGVVAAYFGGWVDAVISWFIDFMLAFPFLLFAIAVIPVVNTLIADSTGDVTPMKRILTIIIVFSAFGWMGTARLVRGQVLSLREREYVEAARAAGAGGTHIMLRQILPNLWAPILVTFSLAVPATVTAEAALSFLNIGVIEPTPDWGRMINNSIPWMRADPMYTFVPGFLILVLVLAFNLFGDTLRDALDPKSVR
jgi:peptide/nickel transport system permease protein